MRRILSIGSIVATAIALSACANGGGLGGMGMDQTIGTGLGGVGGGFLGNMIGRKGSTGNTIATIGGTLVGAYAGSMIGREFDRTDQMWANQAMNGAQPGQFAQWNNTNTGKQFVLTPGQQVPAPAGAAPGSQCRAYQVQVTTTQSGAAQTEQSQGTACRQADGSWQY